jgi:hypothetical protein
MEQSDSETPEPGKLYFGLRVISPDPNPEEDFEDVTFTGPVFPRVSASLQERPEPA